MKKSKVLLIAALVAIMVCGTALAATGGLRLTDLLFVSETMKPEVDAMIQDVDQAFETAEVRVTVNEGLYSSQSATAALSLTMENKTPGEKYYILAENFTAGGKDVVQMENHSFTEFVLEDEPVSCAASTRIAAQSGDAVVEFDYAILKLTGKILPREDVVALRELQDDGAEVYYDKVRELTQQGYVVVENDGVVETGMDAENVSYKDTLIASGNFVEMDSIHVSIPLYDTPKETWIYDGEKGFRMDGVELIVERLEASVLSATVELRVIVDDPEAYKDYWLDVVTPEALTKDGKEYRQMWFIHGAGEQTDFARREDGRYESIWQMEGMPHNANPEALEIIVSAIDPVSGGIQAENALIAKLSIK